MTKNDQKRDQNKKDEFAQKWMSLPKLYNTILMALML